MRPGPLRGPAFGTYASEDVGWLVKDLSDRELEQPTGIRERAVQGGRAHYSESLPIEYVPTTEYRELYISLLHEWASVVALGVAMLGELILATRGREVVLVSLARAGTPIGILLRRWFQASHGLDLEHYSISIIRDKGLDEEAVGWLQRSVGLERVVFVDGWTGKGAITACLRRSVSELGRRGLVGLDPTLGVVADPAGVTPLCGTRRDILIPSSCLNSTVSGLVSRTVHSSSLIGPGEFHGAKFYQSMRTDDLSANFLDVVAGSFPARAELPAPALVAPDDRGLKACRQLARRLQLADLNLIKPGIGEATRVLLRRGPERLLLRDPAERTVQHLVLLAADRQVPVDIDPGLPFEAVGIIRAVAG